MPDIGNSSAPGASCPPPRAVSNGIFRKSAGR